MKSLCTRAVVSTVAACVAVSFVADAARAAEVPVVSGTFTMVSERGDLQGQGRSYSLPARQLRLGAVGATGNDIRVYQALGEHWDVRLEAPGHERLRRGVYANARQTSDDTYPGLRVFGANRACGDSTGTFTIIELDYGPHEYVQSLRATFEYHCGGRAPALRGELNLRVAPAPPAVRVDVRLSPARTRYRPSTGTVELHGTVACPAGQPGGVSIVADVVEEGRGGAIGAGSDGFNACPKRPARWSITAAGTRGRPFAGRDVEVDVHARAFDNPYSDYAPTGSRYAVDALSSKVRIDYTSPPPPPPLTIDVAYDSGRVVENSGMGFAAELNDTVRCSRPVSATVMVLVSVSSGYQAPGGIDGFRCSPTPRPWRITTDGGSDLLFMEEGSLPATIEAKAIASYTDASGAYPVLADTTIEVEVDPFRQADDLDLKLVALIAASLVALGGSALFVMRRARRRRRSRSTAVP